MRTARGSVVGYNAQAVVDDKNKLIVAQDVTNEETDLRQLSGMAQEAKANLGVDSWKRWPTRDTARRRKWRCARNRGLRRMCPKPTPAPTRRRDCTARAGSSTTRSKDVYVCPAGTALTYRFSTDEKGRQVRYYRTRACKGCALKKQCTRNRTGRTITREQDEAVMEAMAARVASAPGENEVAQAVMRTSVWDAQSDFWATPTS